jgi:hypothetical protein
MNVVPKEAIEVVAQSIGITNLSSDVVLALAPDVEYRVREIMQVCHLMLVLLNLCPILVNCECYSV